MDVRFRLDGREPHRMFEGMRKRADNLRPANRRIGKAIDRSIHRQILTSGSPRWPAKSPKSGPGRPLIRTRRLLQSWRVLSVTKNRVVLGSKEDKAAGHQLGLPRRTGRVPAHSRLIRTAFGRQITPVRAQVSAHTVRMPALSARPVGILDKDLANAQKELTEHVLGP